MIFKSKNIRIDDVVSGDSLYVVSGKLYELKGDLIDDIYDSINSNADSVDFIDMANTHDCDVYFVQTLYDTIKGMILDTLQNQYVQQQKINYLIEIIFEYVGDAVVLQETDVQVSRITGYKYANGTDIYENDWVAGPCGDKLKIMINMAWDVLAVKDGDPDNMYSDYLIVDSDNMSLFKKVE